MRLERSGQGGGPCSWDEGQRDSQRWTSLAWEFCPGDSLALWLLIKKCQLEVTLVIAICQRGQRAVCGQGAKGKRLDVEKAKSVMCCSHTNGLQWVKRAFHEERNLMDRS